jgi:anti-sigma factor RsiW
MACENHQSDLVALLYDDIEAADRARVVAHLAACPSCREAFAALETARGLVREAAPAVPRAPRVLVVGRPRARGRVALAFAAGISAALLAAGGAVAGYVYGSGRASTAPSSAADTAVLVEQEVGRRWAALEASLAAARSPQATALPAAITKNDLETAIRRLERRIDGSRASDLDYVQNLITASERRTGSWIGETQKALRYVALANNPALSEQ